MLTRSRLRALISRVIALSLCLIWGCGAPSEEQGRASPSAGQGLKVEDLSPGIGVAATPGATVRVHYSGWLFDAATDTHKGAQFDSSRTRNEPFEFRLGAGDVIPGWDRGVVGMKVGGTRRLTIPPALAYGERGAGGVIPPDATLLFEIELLEVR